MPTTYFFFPYLEESVERRFSADMPSVRRKSPSMDLESLMPSTALMLPKDARPMMNAPVELPRLLQLLPDALLLLDPPFAISTI